LTARRGSAICLPDSVTPKDQRVPASQSRGLEGAYTLGEYLSVAELSKRIPYAQQTIRNMMSRGVLKLGVHYVKPRGRVILKWSAIQAWLNGAS